MSVQPSGGNRVIFIPEGVMQDHDPEIVRRNAGLTQCNELGDGVIFAVASAAGQGRERGRPHVDLAMLRQIAGRSDGEVDRTVDLTQPGAAVARLRGVDDGEKLQCGRRYATFPVAVAQGELHHFVVEATLHAEPFVAQSAIGQAVRDLSEGFGGFL